jgi:hypothetical protein
MHYYRPAPFLIMDEIDAALDPVNVHKVRTRACTCQRARASRDWGEGLGLGAD